MVTDLCGHLAARFFGLAFELLQELNSGAGARSPVEDVAGLDELFLSADPLELLVDQPEPAEQLDEGFIVAVDVADGKTHGGLGGGELPGALLGACRACEGECMDGKCLL